MKNKEIISVSQLYLFLYIGIVVTGILSLPHPMYIRAHQNMWLSLIIGSLVGYPLIWTAAYFNRIYPQKNLPDIIIDVFGHWIGTILLICYSVILCFQSLFVIKEYQIYLALGFYQFTPPAVLIGLPMIATLYACHKGIESIGRVTQIIFPILLLFSITVLTLSLPDIDWKAILPVLEQGIAPPLRASFIPIAWFSEFTWTFFCLNHLSKGQEKKILKIGNGFVALTTLTLLFFFIDDLGILGPLNGVIIYPTHIVERYIQIGFFIERVSSLFMSIWVLGMFVKIVFLIYILLKNLSRVFRQCDYHLLNFPVHVLIFSLSLIFFNNIQSLFSIAFPLFLIVNPIGNIALPAIIVIGAWYRVRKHAAHS
ncbi:MAG: endospore germination permease [Sporolactobacillus sp.]